MSKNRSVNRQERNGRRGKDHGPLLRLVEEEETIRKASIKARTRSPEPLTEAQRTYDSAIHANTITFGIGPAGTGKTWWAAIRATEALKEKRIKRIIITRPAIEAGESMGFLPGELDEKYEPYFRPVREALEEGLGSTLLEYLINNGYVEARPLAFLRGSTLKDAWVIADEMQNATKTQMQLLLSRIGENAKFIINGDPNQCDLPDINKSGLIDATKRLQHIRGVDVVRFTTKDIVRSGICQEIVEAYQNPDEIRYDNDSGVMRTLGLESDSKRGIGE